MKQLKKSVYFIATKYKNNPTKVSFYTIDGHEVPEKNVQKKNTKTGVKLYTFATT